MLLRPKLILVMDSVDQNSNLSRKSVEDIK